MGTAATTTEQLPAGDFQLAVVLSRYNEDIVDALLDGTRRAWRAHGGREAALRITESLRTSGIQVLGAVLNNRTYPIPAALYKRL